LVATSLAAPTEEAAVERLGHLASITGLPRAYAEQLRDGAAESPLVPGSEVLRARINELLAAHGISALEEPATGRQDVTDDDIPF
jgi:hypothetical protein